MLFSFSTWQEYDPVLWHDAQNGVEATDLVPFFLALFFIIAVLMYRTKPAWSRDGHTP